MIIASLWRFYRPLAKGEPLRPDLSCVEAAALEYFLKPMDKFISICAMPIGVLICFGPALVIWLAAELKAPREDQNKKK
jgi:hypothetical protein